jgi:hypothetical protein
MEQATPNNVVQDALRRAQTIWIGLNLWVIVLYTQLPKDGPAECYLGDEGEKLADEPLVAASPLLAIQFGGRGIDRDAHRNQGAVGIASLDLFDCLKDSLPDPHSTILREAQPSGSAGRRQ